MRIPTEGDDGTHILTVMTKYIYFFLQRLSPKQQMLMIYILGMAHFKTEELTVCGITYQLSIYTCNNNRFYYVI